MVDLTDKQRGLLIFLKIRQLPDNPAYCLAHSIAGLEAAVKSEAPLAGVRISSILEQEGIPLEAWDGLPLADTRQV